MLEPVSLYRGARRVNIVTGLYQAGRIERPPWLDSLILMIRFPHLLPEFDFRSVMKTWRTTEISAETLAIFVSLASCCAAIRAKE